MPTAGSAQDTGCSRQQSSHTRKRGRSACHMHTPASPLNRNLHGRTSGNSTARDDRVTEPSYTPSSSSSFSDDLLRAAAYAEKSSDHAHVSGTMADVSDMDESDCHEDETTDFLDEAMRWWCRSRILQDGAASAAATDASLEHFSPLPPPLCPPSWRVADAFLVVLRHVLHFADHVLLPTELLVIQTILSLCQGDRWAASSAKNVSKMTLHKDGYETNDEYNEQRCDQLTAADLLLRLALRKPAAFTLDQLEAFYGSFMRVHSPLTYSLALLS